MLKDILKDRMFRFTILLLLVMLVAIAYLGNGGAGSPFLSIFKSSGGSEVSKATKGRRIYSKFPSFKLSNGKNYQALITTTYGDFTIDLFEDIAPKTVTSFVYLSKQKFYNGLTFHRVVKNILIQGGDPTGTGKGGPGYVFENEIPPNAPKFSGGIVGMANSGKDKNGSQFFILSSKVAREQISTLDGNYTVFGKVISGQEVVDRIASVQVNGEIPLERIVINKIEIIEK